MFFNQSLVNFRLTARETLNTPILSAVLYIDKNIANEATFELYISGPFFFSENVYYWNYFNTPRIRLQANGVNKNERLVFNVSSDSLECSAGTKTFVMVPVKVYALSLVGSFLIDVYADARKLIANKDHKHYVKAEGIVDSGKDNYSYVKIMYIIYVFMSKTSGSLTYIILSAVVSVAMLRQMMRCVIV